MFPSMTVPTIRTAALLLGAILTLGGCGGTSSDGTRSAAGLEIEDARVREPVPGRTMTAGYFTARNRADQAVTLVAVSSPAAASVEMHVSEQDGDMMRMRQLDSVEIGAGETVRFEPGGRHLMLFGIESLPEEGIDLVFERSDGETMTVRFRTASLGEG